MNLAEIAFKDREINSWYRLTQDDLECIVCLPLPVVFSLPHSQERGRPLYRHKLSPRKKGADNMTNLTTIFHAFLHRAEERWVAVKAATLVLWIEGCCDKELAVQGNGAVIADTYSSCPNPEVRIQF